MKLSFKFTLAVALLLAAAACKPVAQLPVEENFQWLTGEWIGSGGEYGETWRYIGLEDRMEGIAWKLMGSDTVENETMQLLYRREKLFYMAQPAGQGPVYFEVTEQGTNSFVASNPFHDFPNKIEYRREGSQMKATISSDERKVDFDFVRR